MRNQIEIPPEIRQFQAQQWRLRRWRMWARTSLVALPCAAVLCGLFWLKGTPPPPGLTVAFLLVPLVFPGLFFVPMPFLVRRTRNPWRWDDQAVEVRGRRYPWRAFQQFRVERECLIGISGQLVRPGQDGREHFSLPPAVKVADYAVFKLQFRDRFLERGLWLAINARAADIEPLAAMAARRVGGA